MSSDTPSTPKSSESKDNSPPDLCAEFERVKLENPNEVKLEPELYSETDIRRLINGEWRNVENNKCETFKLEDNKFKMKVHERNHIIKYAIGFGSFMDRLMASVENNKIVLSYSTKRGKEIRRSEYYMENERLQQVEYYHGRMIQMSSFERVGDPEPE